MGKIIFIVFLSLVLVNNIAVEPELKKFTLSEIITHFSNKHKISPKLVNAILFVESNHKINAYNKRSKDYGIAQINIRNIKRLGLNKEKLLTSIEYSVEEGIKIMAWFKEKYEPIIGNKWVAKYNCGVRKGCEKTRKSKKYINKIYAKL